MSRFHNRMRSDSQPQKGITETMSEAPIQFSTMVCFALYTTVNTIIRDYSRSLRHRGLTYPQVLVLVALWEEDDVSMSVLSQKTLLDLPTLTPIVQRLVKAEWVTVRRATADKRKKLVQLNPQGHHLQPEINLVFERMCCQLTLSKREQTQLLTLCHKIRSQL